MLIIAGMAMDLVLLIQDLASDRSLSLILKKIQPSSHKIAKLC